MKRKESWKEKRRKPTKKRLVHPERPPSFNESELKHQATDRSWQITNQLTSKIADARSRMTRAKKLSLGCERFGLNLVGFNSWDICCILEFFHFCGQPFGESCTFRTPELSKAIVAQLEDQRKALQSARDQLQLVVDNFEDFFYTWFF